MKHQEDCDCWYDPGTFLTVVCLKFLTSVYMHKILFLISNFCKKCQLIAISFSRNNILEWLKPHIQAFPSITTLHWTTFAIYQEFNDHTVGGIKIYLLQVSFSLWLWCKGWYEHSRRELVHVSKRKTSCAHKHKAWYLKQKIATEVCFVRMQQTEQFKWLFYSVLQSRGVT